MISPFLVDVDVMSRIRRMTSADASDVARLHEAAMGSSLWGRLGRPFLTALYRQLVRHPSFHGFVYEEDGRIRGFIAGTEDASRLFRSTFTRRGMHLIRPGLDGLLRHPGLARPLLETPRYFGQSSPGDDVPAESLFCSFEPDLRGKRVSGHINKVLFDELAASGQTRVKITTEVDNEGANRQLTSWGFVDQGTFRFYGKAMRCYVLDLTASPRVEPRRHPR